MRLRAPGKHSGSTLRRPPTYATAGAEELYAFYARPECWGTGVGRSLMRSTRSVWAERGTRAGYLWVLEHNTRGRDFYRKGGWRQDPTAAPSGSGPDALEIRYELTGIGAGGLLHSGRSATTPGGTPAPAAPGDTPRRRTR
ncbi:GNAT family N-acetyltransferase [Streptomyces anulatus]|uniref:GNAT family N-acetyltransferase n=1 Tax=Streptomyces anulatus TaxID=1892 RepID=UPI00342267CC